MIKDKLLFGYEIRSKIWLMPPISWSIDHKLLVKVKYVNNLRGLCKKILKKNFVTVG